jgi:hypothetical protein
MQPYGPENAAIALAETENQRESGILIEPSAFGDAARDDVIGAAELYLVRYVENKVHEAYHVGGLRVDRAVAGHLRTVDVHLDSDVRAFEFYEYLSSRVFVVQRKVLPVPVRTSRHRAVPAAGLLVDERIRVVLRVRNSHVRIRRIVEVHGVGAVGRVGFDEFPGRFTQIDLYPVALLRRIDFSVTERRCQNHRKGGQKELVCLLPSATGDIRPIVPII